MNAYRFAAYPSNSSVASGVTLLVSAWFFVASGAILLDASPSSAQREARAVVTQAEAAKPIPATLAVAPDAHFTITVEARRIASL